MAGSSEVLPSSRKRAQIALEFMIVYSFVLVIFMILFVIVVNQRALTLNQQEYSSLQLIAQNIANYINQALSSGNGYNATVLIPGEIGTAPYTIKVSSTGVVITNLTIGKKSTVAYAFSRARSLQINGTVAASSGGVTIYQIRNIGQVSIANSHGTVYIDQAPVSTLPLTNFFTITQTSGIKMAKFQNNGATSSYSSNTYVQAYAPPIAGSNVPFTVAMWIYVPSNSNSNMPFFGMNSYQALEFFRAGLSTSTNQVFLHRCSSADTGESTIPVMSYNTWHFVAVSVSAPNYYFQLDGSNSVVTNTHTYSNNGYITIGAQAAQCDGSVFVGDIADVQLYNTALSASQLQSLYVEGMSAPPVQSANIVGWWTLNGNTNDYSGNGYVGTPSNITYGTLAQLVGRSVLGNGGTNIDSLIGMIASNGTFNQSGKENVALYSNSSGYVKTFLTGGNVSNIAVDSYAFNGNQSTVGNLIGWWPLVASAPDASSTVYDLSTRYNNGAFYDNGAVTNSLWVNYSPDSTNFMTAQFDGSSSKIDGSGLYANPISALAWVYPTNTAKTTDLDTIMEFDGQSADAGTYQFFLVNKGSGYCGGVAGTLYLWNPSGGFCTSLVVPTDKWSLVGFSSNATDQTVYLNTQFQSAATSYQPGPANTMYVIGDQGSNRYFEGNISNVQLYSGILPSSQVAQVYGEGVDGVPIQSTSALLAWWPFAGDMNSYASSPANITPTNVIFVNNNYVNNYASGSEVASFNGVNGYVDLNNPTYLQFAPGTTYTLGAWIKVNSCTDGAIFGHGASSYTFYIYPSGSSCYLDFASSTVANIGTGVQIPTNQWIYVDAVNNIGTNVYLYVNGQQYGPYTFTNSYSYSEDLRIGDSQSDPGFFFNGQIANAQIYNIGLTPTQIAQLYQQGPPQIAYKNLTFG